MVKLFAQLERSIQRDRCAKTRMRSINSIWCWQKLQLFYYVETREAEGSSLVLWHVSRWGQLYSNARENFLIYFSKCESRSSLSDHRNVIMRGKFENRIPLIRSATSRNNIKRVGCTAARFVISVDISYEKLNSRTNLVQQVGVNVDVDFSTSNLVRFNF